VTVAALPAAIRQWYKFTFAPQPTNASEGVGSAISDGALVVSAESVARQYAHATFDVARRHDRLDAVDRDLAAVAALVAAHPELRHVFATPIIPPKKKRALVEALLTAAGEMTPEVKRLLLMLADRDRLMIIGEIAQAYSSRRMAADRSVNAEVRTATPLDETQKATLARVLSAATGRRVTVSNEVDPAVVGGAVARVGGLVFDGSVARQIQRMRQRLLAEA
jgi:F-type H+-transporting ATPase subunit delta